MRSPAHTGIALYENSFQILMVDDVTRYQKLYAFAIKEAIDADVSFATNGEEALEALKEADRFQLIILDLNMPKLGGEETLRRIRQDPNLDNLPVIILTGDPNEDLQRRLLELGADDFIEKGSPPELFVARLKAQMRFKIAIDRLTTMAMDMDIFAAGVLHDIRNLESNVLSICHIAKMLLAEDPIRNRGAILEEISALQAIATKIGSYANDIIQMVRDTRSRTEIQSCDLKEIIAWSRDLLLPQSGLHGTVISWQEPETMQSVMGDEKFLKLATFNILQNSIKYCAPGTIPKIVVSQQLPPSDPKSSDGMVTTCFRDFGIGIPPSELKSVFRPFVRGSTTAKRKDDSGFGLGLSLVMKVVSAMKGRVWAELPADGPGTRICLALPQAKSDEAHADGE